MCALSQPLLQLQGKTVFVMNFGLPKSARQTVQTQIWLLEGVVWSGSSPFAIPLSILLIPALKTHVLFENRKRIVFEILE